MDTIQDRRNRERAKYEWLLENRPSYGRSNHGESMIDEIISMKPDCVVDLGCGNNQFARTLRLSRIRAVGVDFANPDADVVRPMHCTKLQTNLADVVTAFDSLEHLLPEEVGEVMDEISRVGRPGASLFFTISTVPSRITAKGENLHPTVKPISWWVEQIERIADHVTVSGRLVQATIR